MTISFSKLNISKKDFTNVKNILKSGWLTHGKYNTLFESEFAKFTKAKYAITVSSCTAGLHLSCIAAGFKKGDEVIVPSQTHVATAHSVEYTGAKAIFADVTFPQGNLDLGQIKSKVTKKTKGIILVHMAGYPCNILEISNFCKKNKIILLEDCAHALGTYKNSTHVGNYGMTGSFSFYPTKQITTGEGGMIITNNKKIFKKIKMLKAFGIDKDITNRKKVGDYDVKYLGFNFRITDFQAAIGYGQMLDYKKNLQKRKIIAKRYIKNFTQNKNIKFVPFSNDCYYFIFQIFCKKRDKLASFLKKKKVGFSVHYKTPVPKMTYYKKKYKINMSDYLNATKYGNMNISLPNYPKLKLSEVDMICKTINQFFMKYAK
jgi:perosamine synthetase